MSKTNELHKKAMELANQAVEADRNGDSKQAQQYFAEAFSFEKQAAMLLVDKYESEPSRSVLFRRAGALALQAGKYRAAEQMAAFGLSGNPPEEIAVELRDVLYQSFQHLKMVA